MKKNKFSKVKTVAIFDRVDADVTFITFEDDMIGFDRVYINQWTDDPRITSLQNVLSDVIYDETGEILVDLLDEFPVDAVKNGANVITIGFLP